MNYQQYLDSVLIEGCVLIVHSKENLFYYVNGKIEQNSKLPNQKYVETNKKKLK